MIKDYPEPVGIKQTQIILDQMIHCIGKLKINSTNGTCFFCKVPFGKFDIKVLMTNYHVLKEKDYNWSTELNILLNDDKEAKVIKLEEDRRTYFNEKYDIALIELLETDNINHYLELDDNLFKEEINAFYKNISLYIPQYPYGKTAVVSYGLSIGNIDNFEIKYKCSTEHGSSGSPILNLVNNKVIGIHKKGSLFDYNMGTLLKFPLNDFFDLINKEKDKQYIDTNIFPGKDIYRYPYGEKISTLNGIISHVKWHRKPGPKMNIIFQTINYEIDNFSVKYGTTIDQLLKNYLIRMNRFYLYQQKEYYPNEICFLYNASQIKFGDKTPIEKYFQFAIIPKIFVNSWRFEGNFVNWTYEELERIKLLFEKLELPFGNIDKAITIKFNNKGKIKEMLTGGKISVNRLIDRYRSEIYNESGKRNLDFIFNGQSLYGGVITGYRPYLTLYENGFKNNSEIIVEEKNI